MDKVDINIFFIWTKKWITPDHVSFRTTRSFKCFCVILLWEKYHILAKQVAPKIHLHLCKKLVLHQLTTRDTATAATVNNAIPRGGYSVRFWIGMLSIARRLETLQGSKKGGRNYTFCPILMKNRGRNTTFSSFLLKYRGRNYTNFQETRKRGVEMAEHM